MRFAGVGMCVGQTSAPPAEAPSPEVDQALRARIAEFYQDHVGGKFRQAEALVAEETKDYFYSASQAPLFELRN